MKSVISSGIGSLLFTALACLAASCDCKPPSEPDDPGPGNAEERISFIDYKVGQTSRYIWFKGESYYLDTASSPVVYTRDTLVVRITGVTADGFTVEEYFTQGSESRGTESNFEPDSIYRYTITIARDSVFVENVQKNLNESRLFMGFGGIGLADIMGERVTMKGWKTSHAYVEGYWQAFMEYYVQFGRMYPRLNVVTNNSAMAVDGPGYTIVYSKTHGVVRRTSVGWWTQSGNGWDLL